MVNAKPPAMTKPYVANIQEKHPKILRKIIQALTRKHTTFTSEQKWRNGTQIVESKQF